MTLFYPAKIGNTLNRQPYTPELLCGRVMLNPHYPVTLAAPVPALCDSGAFQDTDTATRLLPWTALDRQLAYERRLQQTWPGWHFEGLITYDQMLGVDEALVDGKKVKRRGTAATARPAIAETLRAARYYSRQRARIAGRIYFAAQGATPDQYLAECVEPLLALLQPGDGFAFGGFCIIGKVPSLKPLFVETAARVFPLLAGAGVQHAHLLGIGVCDMVAAATRLAAPYGIAVSTDTSAIETRSVMGAVFAAGRWTKQYSKAEKLIAGGYHPCELAHANLARYSAWAEGLTRSPAEEEVAA